jgi:hypothetical protein
MTRDEKRQWLLQVLKKLQDTTHFMDRIDSVRRSGGSGCDYEPTMNRMLDELLDLLENRP